MEQDPVVKTEVKIEIDIAEEPPQSWYTTEKNPHGLCVRPPSPKTLSAKEKNKAKCRAYRRAVKQDPVRYAEEKEKEAERSRRYRQRPVTAEEQARLNEAGRLRVAKSRARKKAQAEAQKPHCTRAKERRGAKVTTAQRERWAADKRKERSQWTAQKWRHHREKTLQAYHERNRKRHDRTSAATQEETTVHIPEPFTDQSNVPRPTSPGPMEDMSVHLPYKKTVSLKEKKQKKVLPKALSTIQGTRKIQHVVELGSGRIFTCNLACFCNVCLGKEDGRCTSSDFVLERQEVKTTLLKSWKEDPANEEGLARLEARNSSLQPAQPLQVPQDLPPSLSSPLRQSHEERRAFFMHTQEKIKLTSSFEELHAIAARSASAMLQFPLPPLPDLHVTTLPTVTIDAIALSLIQKDGPRGHFPIAIQADGNSFPRTVSLLSFGHKDEHVEMRVRIVCELCLHASRYVNPTYLSKGSSDCGLKLLETLMRYAKIPYNVSNSALQVLQSETFTIRKPSEDCGMWAVFAASNVLQTPLTSVFPDKGEADKKTLTKRTVFPFFPSQHQPRYVMWSTCHSDQTDEFRCPNHFVPLLSLHPQEDVSVVDSDNHNQACVEVEEENHQTNSYPEAEDFYQHTWLDMRDYVCQVVKVLPREGLIHINFMTEQGQNQNLFCWTARPDQSWEDIHTFTANSRKIHIGLNEQYSTQRKQMFSIIQ